MQDKEKNGKHEHAHHGGRHAHGDQHKQPEPGAPETAASAGAEAKPEAAPQPAAPQGKEHGKHKTHTAEEVAALNDRYVRMMADFDNFRKRTLRERSEIIQRATEDLLKDLLPVVDHLELAMEAARTSSESQSAVVNGFKLVGDQFVTVLKAAGLTPFESVGKPFDPSKQEAISTMPSDTVPENNVVAEVRKGYLLGERLLRAARVVISSGKPGAAAEPEGGAGADVEYEEKAEG